MKSFKFIRTVLLTILMGISLASCRGEDDIVAIEPETENPKEYIVSLGWIGEIINISDFPLTYSTGNNDLYGIQVHSCPNTDDKTQNYTPYALGLFNDVSNITIKLFDGYKYKFEATMAVDGKNIIPDYGGEHGYGLPFQKPLTNSFKYSSLEYFSTIGFYYGTSWSTSKEWYMKRPEMDRYYGELTDYVPSESGRVANINMKRTSFGVKVIAEDMTAGKLTVKINGAIDMIIEHPETEAQELLSFEYVKQAWEYSEHDQYGNTTNEDDTPWEYSEHIGVSLTWAKNDSVEVPLISKGINFKRNKLTVITIKVVDKGDENDLGVTYDETGEMEIGDTIRIDTDESSENEVNPEP